MVQRFLSWARPLSLGLLSVAAAGVGGCFLILDFSEEVESEDAGPADAGPEDANDLIDATEADAGPTPDEHESNDTLGTATLIAPPNDIAATVAPAGDHDYYHLNLAAATDLTLTLSFANSDDSGDLDLNLYTGDGVQVSSAEGTEEIEKIEHSAALANRLAEGAYVVEVFSKAENVTKAYTLTLVMVP